MRKHTILKSIPKGADDRAFKVLIEDTDGLTVIWYVTFEGVSRHNTEDNLDKCIGGKLSFEEDAVFFFKAKAIPMVEHLLKCYMLSYEDGDFLRAKIKNWEK